MTTFEKNVREAVEEFDAFLNNEFDPINDNGTQYPYGNFLKKVDIDRYIVELLEWIRDNDINLNEE